MKYSVLSAILMGFFTVILQAQERIEPIIFAVKADKTMIIDGKDTEACYARAQKTAEFKNLLGGKVNPTSQVRVAYDEKRLYFFYDCYELKNSPAQPADAIELFINGTEEDRSFYYQLFAALDGTVVINQKMKNMTDTLRQKFEFKFQRKGNGFCCEIAVDRDLFPRSQNLLWRVNFNRDRLRDDYPNSYSCWSVTGPDFHEPSRFGYMFLGDQKQFFKNYYGKRAAQKINLIMDLLKKYPAAVSAKKVTRIKQKYQTFEKSLNETPSTEKGEQILNELEIFRKKIIVNHIKKKLKDFGQDIPAKELKKFIFPDSSLSVSEKWEINKIRNHFFPANHTGKNYFDSFLPADFFDKIARGEFNRNIFPEFSDRKAWEKARKNKYAEIIIARADAIPEKQVPVLRFSNYRRFVLDGNRADYENRYFARRKNVGNLALALCLTGDKEKYMPRLLDHVIAILEEFSWCVPAHTKWDNDQKRLLDHQAADLFASETGSMMAILHNILGKELDKYVENLSERIREETLKRTVYTVFYHPESSSMHWWYKLESPSNWCVWCSNSNLMAALLLEKDPEKIAVFVRELLKVNSHYAFRFPEDGYCDEGPGYYGKSGLKLFSSLYLLHRALPGSMDKLFAEPKIRAIFEYIAHVGIGKNDVVNYGDNGPHAQKDINMILCGQVLNSDIMLNLYPDLDYILGGNAEHLHSPLKILFEHPEIRVKQQKQPPFSYFKDRLAILRSEGFSVAVKSGHNAEMHNHNDLGHITVYFKGEPIIVDPGHERYSRINFSDKRYTLWYNRGSGHNAPVFGSVEQLQGRRYFATFRQADRKKVIIDLSKAYPENAGVQEFTRSVDFSSGQVTIADRFKLSAQKPAVIKFFAPCNVKKISDSTLQIGDVQMTLHGIKVQKISSQKMERYWKQPLAVIELKSNRSDYKITFHGK